MIYYREITHNATAPTSPLTGDMWIKPVGDGYQVYVYLDGDWIPMLSGGIYAAETAPDTHYINVMIQETEPSDIQMGWLWIKMSVLQVYMWLGSFVPLIGAEV